MPVFFTLEICAPPCSNSGECRATDQTRGLELRSDECLPCVTKWEETVVRQKRREITHFVSGVMMLNLFSNDFCVMYGLREFDLALRLLQRNAFWLRLSCDHFTLAPLHECQHLQSITSHGCGKFEISKAIECKPRSLSGIQGTCQIPYGNDS